MVTSRTEVARVRRRTFGDLRRVSAAGSTASSLVIHDGLIYVSLRKPSAPEWYQVPSTFLVRSPSMRDPWTTRGLPCQEQRGNGVGQAATTPSSLPISAVMTMAKPPPTATRTAPRQVEAPVLATNSIRA